MRLQAEKYGDRFIRRCKEAVLNLYELADDLSAWNVIEFKHYNEVRHSGGGDTFISSLPEWLFTYEISWRVSLRAEPKAHHAENHEYQIKELGPEVLLMKEQRTKQERHDHTAPPNHRHHGYHGTGQ